MGMAFCGCHHSEGEWHSQSSLHLTIIIDVICISIYISIQVCEPSGCPSVYVIPESTPALQLEVVRDYQAIALPTTPVTAEEWAWHSSANTPHSDTGVYAEAHSLCYCLQTTCYTGHE